MRALARADHHVVAKRHLGRQRRNRLIWIGAIRVRDADQVMLGVANSSLDRCTIASVAIMLHQLDVGKALGGGASPIQGPIVDDDDLVGSREISQHGLELGQDDRAGHVLHCRLE